MDASLQHLRRNVAPDKTDNFVKRLAWDQLTPGLAARAHHPDPSDYPQDPPWWTQLTSLRQAAINGLDHPGLEQCCRDGAFVHVWRRVAAFALQTLKASCEDLAPKLALNIEAWLRLASALLERLCATVDQAL